MNKVLILLIFSISSLYRLFSQDIIFTYGENNNLPPIRFVGDRDYAPIEWLEDNKANGIIPSLLPYLADVMDRTIEYQLVDWGKAQEMVKNGDADVLTVFSPNDDRVKYYDFVDGVLEFEMSIFVTADNITIHNISDLEGLNVGTNKGGFLRNYLEDKSKANLITMKDHISGFEDLLSGEVDAVATTKWVGAYYIQKSGIKGIKYVNEPLIVKDTHMGIRKGNEKLKEELNQAIKELQKEGTIQKLTKQWDNLEIIYFTRGNFQNLIIILSISFIVLVLAFLFSYIVILKRQVRIKTSSLKENLELLHHTQDKLVQSQKIASLSSLISGISHAINTPLGNSVTLSSFISDKNNEIKDICSKIDNNRLSKLVDDQNSSILLIDENLSRIVHLINSFKQLTNQRFDVEKKRFNINEVITNAIYQREEMIKSYNTAVDIDGDNTLELESYPIELTEVIVHLISNSLRHGFQGIEKPKIKIGYKQSIENTEIYVSDNGVGLDIDNIDRLFDPFFTTQLGKGSSGLGLNIVYTVVTGLLEGEIKAENLNGAKFTIILPNSFSE